MDTRLLGHADGIDRARNELVASELLRDLGHGIARTHEDTDRVLTLRST